MVEKKNHSMASVLYREASGRRGVSKASTPSPRVCSIDIDKNTFHKPAKRLH